MGSKHFHLTEWIIIINIVERIVKRTLGVVSNMQIG